MVLLISYQCTAPAVMATLYIFDLSYTSFPFTYYLSSYNLFIHPHMSSSLQTEISLDAEKIRNEGLCRKCLVYVIRSLHMHGMPCQLDNHLMKSITEAKSKNQQGQMGGIPVIDRKTNCDKSTSTHLKPFLFPCPFPKGTVLLESCPYTVSCNM